MNRLAKLRIHADTALHPGMPSRTIVGVPAGALRDLLAVAEAAGAFIELDGCEATTYAAVATRNDLRAALARLDGEPTDG